MSELNWIKHDGGPMPVPGHVQVLTRRKYSNRDKRPNAASFWDDKNPGDSNWSCSDESVRIVEYAVLGDDDDQASQPAIDAHYTKYAIQPMEFSLANKLDAAQHTVIKYTVRYRDKGGIRDLRAAIRVLELMIEREEKAQANG